MDNDEKFAARAMAFLGPAAAVGLVVGASLRRRRPAAATPEVVRRSAELCLPELWRLDQLLGVQDPHLRGLLGAAPPLFALSHGLDVPRLAADQRIPWSADHLAPMAVVFLSVIGITELEYGDGNRKLEIILALSRACSDPWADLLLSALEAELDRLDREESLGELIERWALATRRTRARLLAHLGQQPIDRQIREVAESASSGGAK